MCGSVGWFPGYPAVLRGLSEVTTLSLPVAWLIVSWVVWYFLLFFMWQLLDGARSRWTRWACLLLAAWFPSQIYFAAVFPLSLTIAAMLGSVFFVIVKRRPIPAAILGIVAGASYVSGAVLAPALLLTSLVCQKGRQRVGAIAGGLGAIAGLAVVPLYAQAAIGKWSAYVQTKKPYGQGVSNPVATMHHRLEPLWTVQDADHRYLDATAWQTLVVFCITLLVLAATFIGMRRGPVESPLAMSPGWWRRVQAWITARITVVDISLALLTIGVALLPLVTGGPASIGSTARNETFVVVGVPLLRKLPPYLLVPVLGAAAFVAWRMAGHFYQNKLF
jgi:hypothetical protein